MYKIEKKHYGFKLQFSGFIKEQEMAEWVNESKETLKEVKSGFNVFVDMRGLNPLPKEASAHMEIGQQLYRKTGMKRSVVILDNDITTMQFRQIAKKTGIYEYERYINAAGNPNYEKAAIEWITIGKDPDVLN